MFRMPLQVYYHLGAFKEAHIFALAAGDLFDVNSKTEYVETIICKCCIHHLGPCDQVLCVN